MSNVPLTLFDPAHPPAADLPGILVLAGLDEAGERAESLRDLVDIVVDAVVSMTDEDGRPHPLRILRIGYGGMDPEAGARATVADADAVILVGEASPVCSSVLDHAVRCGLPVLALRRDGWPLCARVNDLARSYDIVRAEFDALGSLTSRVQRFVAARRHDIDDGPRRRRSRELGLAQTRQRLAAAFAALPPDERLRALMTARMRGARFLALLTDATALLTAAHGEVRAIASALGLDLGGVFAYSLPELRSTQRAALAATALEDGWSPTEILDIENAARLELARGGVRRLLFNSMDDWRAFQDGRRGS